MLLRPTPCRARRPHGQHQAARPACADGRMRQESSAIRPARPPGPPSDASGAIPARLLRPLMAPHPPRWSLGASCRWDRSASPRPACPCPLRDAHGRTGRRARSIRACSTSGLRGRAPAAAGAGTMPLLPHALCFQAPERPGRRSVPMWRVVSVCAAASAKRSEAWAAAGAQALSARRAVRCRAIASVAVGLRATPRVLHCTAALALVPARSRASLLCGLTLSLHRARVKMPAPRPARTQGGRMARSAWWPGQKPCC